MATLDNLDVSINVEKAAVHDLLREFAEKLYSDHGLQLLEARFDWLDVSVNSQKNALLRGVNIETRTHGV